MKIRDEAYDLRGPVSYATDRRDLIKLRGTPTIVVCMPVGAKAEARIFETPDGNRWSGDHFLAPAMVPIQWALNHMRLVVPLNTSMSYLVKWGERSAKARQYMTMQALDMGCDYILYWDDDVLAPPLSVYTLYNFMQQHPEVGLACGVYTTRNDPSEPMIYKRHGEGAYWGFQAGEGAEPEEIFAAGAGFMLARASAVRDMVAANPGDAVWADEFAVTVDADRPADQNNRLMWGHDIRFCRLMAEAGHKVYVHGGVVCDHVDVATSRVYQLAPDSQPYRNNENINTRSYWDAVYTKEGAQSWRTYPEMFERVCLEIPAGTKCFEVGCGVGILGSRVTATRRVEYTGVDTSQVAVDIAQTRFLSCRRSAVRDLTADSEIATAEVVVATELVEHLDEPERDHLLRLVRESPSVRKFIFTVPNNCMPPAEVPEHRALYSADSVRELAAAHLPGWELVVEPVDAQHLIVVLERHGDDALAEQRHGE